MKLKEITLFFNAEFPYEVSCFSEGCIVDYTKKRQRNENKKLGLTQITSKQERWDWLPITSL
jgi:hypothetical protein